MTLHFTTSGDFATIADGLQTITLLRRESPSGPGEVIAHALRRAIDTAEVVGENRRTIDSDGRYTATDVVWSLPAAELAAPPRSGDVIEDSAGRHFNIVETRLVALADRWHCSTRALSIAEGLEDEIDILENTSGVWTVLQENVPGRIQPLETMIVDGATPTSIRRYRIILAEPLDLDHTHRLRGPDDAFIARRKWPGIRSWGNIRSWRRKRFCKQDPLPPTIAKIGSLQTPVISTSRELELQYLLCRFSPEFLIWEYRLMSRLQDLRSELLCDGKITENEVGVIRDYIQENGTLDLADVKFLVELLGDARTVSPSFDALFFPVLKDVLLADGKIGPDEQYYLLKMLYADGNVRESEKQFLRELMAETKEVTPELQALCETAFNAPSTNWSVGGK